MSAATERAWESLTNALAHAIAELGDGNFLIVSHRHINHYVQIAGGVHGPRRIEAASNTYIQPPSAALTVVEYARMAELGWRRATDDAPELVTVVNDPEGSPNFFMDLHPESQVHAVAALLIQTLREVYGLLRTDLLEYHAFSNSIGDFSFPDMPIGRRESVGW